MRKVILYIATSLDGFIARKDGSIDWLTKFESSDEDFGYWDFYNKIDTLIMGRHTYDQALTFGDWPYSGKTTIVVTSSELTEKPEDTIRSYIGNVKSLVEELKKTEGKDIWLVGGATTVSSFMRDHLIDEVIITILPTLLGEGIPLFKDLHKELDVKLQSAEKYKGGAIQLHYTHQDNKVSS